MDITDLNLFAWCKCLRHLGKTIMFLVVAGIIALAAYSTFASALLPGIENGNAGVKFGYILLSIIYLTTVFMVLWSYMATMTTDPGTTPPGWHPFELSTNTIDLETGQSIAAAAGGTHALSTQQNTNLQNIDAISSSLHDPLIATRLSDHFQASARLHQQHYTSQSPDEDPYEATLAIMERPRWCKKCNAWKPPRAHHCSMTRRCVLKMDHYCVWVGNTVGLLNYKQFVLFLFWAFLGCFMSAALLLKPTIRFFSASDPTLRPLITSFLAFVFTAAFSVALLGFVAMHMRLIFLNQSTIEAYEKRPLQPWPYDRGFENNLSDVFGSKKKYWLLPLVSEEHRKRLLEETLDVVAVPLPEVSAWQGPLGGVNSGGGGGAAVNGGFSNSIASSPAGNLGHGPSPSNESVGSDLGMVLIERPIST